MKRYGTGIEVSLPVGVRYFRSHFGMQLYWPGLRLPARSVVMVGRIRQMIYDHCDVDAVPFWNDDDEGYLLMEELDSDALAGRIRLYSTLIVIKGGKDE